MGLGSFKQEGASQTGGQRMCGMVCFLPV